MDTVAAPTNSLSGAVAGYSASPSQGRQLPSELTSPVVGSGSEAALGISGSAQQGASQSGFDSAGLLAMLQSQAAGGTLSLPDSFYTNMAAALGPGFQQVGQGGPVNYGPNQVTGLDDYPGGLMGVAGPTSPFFQGGLPKPSDTIDVLPSGESGPGWSTGPPEDKPFDGSGWSTGPPEDKPFDSGKTDQGPMNPNPATNPGPMQPGGPAANQDPYGTGIPQPHVISNPAQSAYGDNGQLGLEDLGNPGLSDTDQFYLAGLGLYYNPTDPQAIDNYNNWAVATGQPKYQAPVPTPTAQPY